jgi:hypothetical protein
LSPKSYKYADHYIEVEKVISYYDTYYPVCREGEEDIPPDDVGGRPGYSEYVQVINTYGFFTKD